MLILIKQTMVGWLVVLGFNATLTAKVISWRSMTPMCFLAFSHQYLHNFSFQSHRLLFSHASAEVRGENTPERKVASTGDLTHNHQVMSPTRSPLSHPGGAKQPVDCKSKFKETLVKMLMLVSNNKRFGLFPNSNLSRRRIKYDSNGSNWF